jgi:hypothetical protein
MQSKYRRSAKRVTQRENPDDAPELVIGGVFSFLAHLLRYQIATNSPHK